MRLVLFLAVVALASPALAQDQEFSTDQSVVVVVGTGQAARVPDFGEFELTVTGEGDVQMQALSALEALRDRVVRGVGAMEGARVLIARTDDVGVSASYPSDCDQPHERVRQQACEDRGAYLATMDIRFRVYPAGMTGQVLSLATELGAPGARSMIFGIDDPQSLSSEAARAAFSNAERTAELMATSGGMRVGRIIRIQDASASYTDVLEAEDIVITGNRIATTPTVALSISPEPVRSTATVRVFYELVP